MWVAPLRILVLSVPPLATCCSFSSGFVPLAPFN